MIENCKSPPKEWTTPAFMLSSKNVELNLLNTGPDLAPSDLWKYDSPTSIKKGSVFYDHWGKCVNVGENYV